MSRVLYWHNVYAIAYGVAISGRVKSLLGDFRRDPERQSPLNELQRLE